MVALAAFAALSAIIANHGTQHSHSSGVRSRVESLSIGVVSCREWKVQEERLKHTSWCKIASRIKFLPLWLSFLPVCASVPSEISSAIVTQMVYCSNQSLAAKCLNMNNACPDDTVILRDSVC